MRLMFLNGTAMSGQRAHAALSGAIPLGLARTAPRYRFFAVRDEFSGLVPVCADGESIEGELYEVSDELLFDQLLPAAPQELELDTVELEDGTMVNAMQLRLERIGETDHVVDITALGGWRAYQEFLAANAEVREVLGR